MTREVAPQFSDEQQHRRDIALSLNQVIRGKINTIGSVTLTTAAVLTTVHISQAGLDSVPIAVPLNTAAAQEIGNGTLFIAERANGYFVLSHANAATTRNFAFAMLG